MQYLGLLFLLLAAHDRMLASAELLYSFGLSSSFARLGELANLTGVDTNDPDGWIPTVRLSHGSAHGDSGMSAEQDYGWMVFKVDFLIKEEVDFIDALNTVVDMVERLLLTKLPAESFKLAPLDNTTNHYF